MKNKDWVSWLMRSYRITFLLIALLLVLGFFGFKHMAKAEFPEMVIRQGHSGCRISRSHCRRGGGTGGTSLGAIPVHLR